MRTGATAAALAAAALLLSACGEEPEQPQSLPPAPSPSPSPSPEPSVLPVPSPSLSGEAGEVERALLDYYAAINTAFATGDLTAYAATHTPDCRACQELTELLRSTEAKGQRFEGAQDELLSYDIPPFRGDAAVADVRFRVTPYSLVTNEGEVVESYEPTETRNLVAFNRVGGRWLVVGVTERAS